MTLINSTYRLQFHRGFTLRDALELVPYLAELGISHLYASPLLAARRGSLHGYDVCDPSRINPEIGTETDLAKLVEALRERNLGLVLDIVPNHMSTDPQNPWWRDVLRHGPASRYAKYFDIDWELGDNGAQAKVLLPILNDVVPHVLQRGEVRVALKDSEVVLEYFEHQLPVSPASLQLLPEPSQPCVARLNSSPEALARFVEQQHYRLVFWRAGDRRLNYRRFFNIAELAGVRTEDSEVFAATHVRVLQWLGARMLDGLRIDHPDGLHNPQKYLDDLRQRGPEAWVVVEKILVDSEELPLGWPVQGTTGYDFLNRLGGLFIDPDGEPALTRFYQQFTGETRNFDEVAVEKKRHVLQNLLAAEVRRLERVAEPMLADFTGHARVGKPQVREALVELAACFPVYRSYVQAENSAVSEADVRHVVTATARARHNKPELGDLLEFLRDLLLLKKRPPGAARFVMLFQQLTGPAMAKGVEDTAFYCFNRFVALNEVGGNPGKFGTSLQSFHDSCRKAQHQWPLSMLASSTHDTKRGEDVRARLALFSEMPEPWIEAVGRWSSRLEKYRLKEQPDRNAEYLFYQTLVGAWPLSRERALAYMQKAAREAKEHTCWSEPNREYEQALERFVVKAMEDREFVGDLEEFVAPLVEPGWLNSLAQTLVKLTAPGIPDTYQGTELWDLSLVDPDNRRPVDFALRGQALETLKGLSAEVVWQRRNEGLPKLWVMWKTLLFRAQRPELFGAKGSYEPVLGEGREARHVIAFMRGGEAVTIAPRLVFNWRKNQPKTALTLPVGLWQNELTSEIIRGGRLLVPELLTRFPVALLSRIHD